MRCVRDEQIDAIVILSFSLQVRPTWTQRSSKGQVPFVELNGEQLADSQLIIKALSRKFGKQEEEKLTQTQMGIARAVDRLVESSFVK